MPADKALRLGVVSLGDDFARSVGTELNPVCLKRICRELHRDGFASPCRNARDDRAQCDVLTCAGCAGNPSDPDGDGRHVGIARVPNGNGYLRARNDGIAQGDIAGGRFGRIGKRVGCRPEKRVPVPYFQNRFGLSFEAFGDIPREKARLAGRDGVEVDDRPLHAGGGSGLPVCVMEFEVGAAGHAPRVCDGDCPFQDTLRLRRRRRREFKFLETQFRRALRCCLLQDGGFWHVFDLPLWLSDARTLARYGLLDVRGRRQDTDRDKDGDDHRNAKKSFH